MEQLLDFVTLETFINHLKLKEDIIGIVQYGSRDYTNMSPGGDYDLNIILDEDVETQIAGLHLHINSIPVDCGIISVKDLYYDESPSDFHSLLAGSKVLFDRNGLLSKQLIKIKEKWKLNIKPIQEGELSFSRFITQHVVDKFENRLYENEVYTRIFLSENIFTLLETYMKINKLDPYNYKNALEIMKNQDNDTYILFEEYVNNHDLNRLLSITKKLNSKVFSKYGGSWKKEEVIFHYKNPTDVLSDQDKRNIIELIF
jgi:hypothetical protein